MRDVKLLLNIYQKLYDQRGVLTEAPALTINPDETSLDQINIEQARQEVTAVMSYLLGVADANTLTISDILRIVKNNYQDQPYWKSLILDYAEYLNERTRQELINEALVMRDQAYDIFQEIQQEDFNRKELVRQFAEKIEKQHFAIDAKKMMKTYFTMYRQDPQKAWEILTTNPGYFAPIITTDNMGRVILSPKEAINENKKIAKFMKSLKI